MYSSSIYLHTNCTCNLNTKLYLILSMQLTKLNNLTIVIRVKEKTHHEFQVQTMAADVLG